MGRFPASHWDSTLESAMLMQFTANFIQSPDISMDKYIP
jgi:hypothetical protein